MAWKTENENKFLDRLGNWSPEFPRNRRVLLRKYLKATKRRINWGQIDSKEIINRVEMELND